MKHQEMAWKGLIPSRRIATAASQTTPAEIKWQNVHIATTGSIKPAKKLLIKLLSIKGSSGSATLPIGLDTTIQLFSPWDIISQVINLAMSFPTR